MAAGSGPLFKLVLLAATQAHSTPVYDVNLDGTIARSAVLSVGAVLDQEKPQTVVHTILDDESESLCVAESALTTLADTSEYGSTVTVVVWMTSVNLLSPGDGGGLVKTLKAMKHRARQIPLRIVHLHVAEAANVFEGTALEQAMPTVPSSAHALALAVAYHHGGFVHFGRGGVFLRDPSHLSDFVLSVPSPPRALGPIPAPPLSVSGTILQLREPRHPLVDAALRAMSRGEAAWHRVDGGSLSIALSRLCPRLSRQATSQSQPNQPWCRELSIIPWDKAGHGLPFLGPVAARGAGPAILSIGSPYFLHVDEIAVRAEPRMACRNGHAYGESLLAVIRSEMCPAAFRYNFMANSSRCSAPATTGAGGPQSR